MEIEQGLGIEEQIKQASYSIVPIQNIKEIIETLVTFSNNTKGSITGKQISKNCYVGVKIQSLEEINVAALYNKSLYHCWWKIKPAKVFMMMQAQTLQDAINDGVLYHVINTNPKIKKKNDNSN